MTSAYDNANQIRYSTSAAGMMAYTFDVNGNHQIVFEPSGAGATTMWSDENGQRCSECRTAAESP
jgi:hypothetical protein